MSRTDRQLDYDGCRSWVLAVAVCVDQPPCRSHNRVHAESEGDTKSFEAPDRARLQLRQPGFIARLDGGVTQSLSTICPR